MNSTLTRLRGPAIRATVAWMVAFGLLFQTLLPVLAAAARAHDPSTLTGVICADHASRPDTGSPAPNDKSLDDCCTVCALLHAAQYAVPTGAVAVPMRWPTASRPLDRARADAPTIASIPVPYSSRAPPQAA